MPCCLRRVVVPSSASAGDFLILPIQRVPRYVMLIKDLLKRTARQHNPRAAPLLTRQHAHSPRTRMPAPAHER